MSRTSVFVLIALVAVALLAALLFVTTTDDARSTGHEQHTPGQAPLGGHAGMIGADVPAPGGPHDLDALLKPPPALPSEPGRLREYNITAYDREIEVADGVTTQAWTFNGTVPGPVIRATEGDRLKINFTNAGTKPHTMHLHGTHPADMDGVFELVEPGEMFTYEFTARPYGMHVYHCHVAPLKKHIAKGLYGAFIVDPPKPRKPATELVMVINGFDTDGDGENNFYTANGKAFYYAKYPIEVKRGQTVRIYLANMTEFDPVNSFHLHGDFFTYYPTGRNQPVFTDMVNLAQGERGIIEIDFANTGLFMFHAHQSEFTELGWMGFFKVVD